MDRGEGSIKLREARKGMIDGKERVATDRCP